MWLLLGWDVTARCNRDSPSPALSCSCLWCGAGRGGRLSCVGWEEGVLGQGCTKASCDLPPPCLSFPTCTPVTPVRYLHCAPCHSLSPTSTAGARSQLWPSTPAGRGGLETPLLHAPLPQPMQLQHAPPSAVQEGTWAGSIGLAHQYGEEYMRGAVWPGAQVCTGGGAGGSKPVWGVLRWVQAVLGGGSVVKASPRRGSWGVQAGPGGCWVVPGASGPAMGAALRAAEGAGLPAVQSGAFVARTQEPAQLA